MEHKYGPSSLTVKPGKSILHVKDLSSTFDYFPSPKKVGTCFLAFSCRFNDGWLVSVAVLGTGDAFGDKRPLLARCDLSASSQPFSSINIISLLSGDKVHSIKFRAAIENIMCNQRYSSAYIL